MERFKVLERESKTKAYSKEGLAKLYAQQVKADPREESYEWIQGIQESLNEQIEELEEQMDSVTVKGKRGMNKSKKQKFDQIQEKIKRHQWHIGFVRFDNKLIWIQR